MAFDREDAPLERYFLEPSANGYLQSLAECLKAVGSECFNGSFQDLIENVIRADQSMIFSFKEDRPKCYLSHSKRQKKTALNLAQKYLRDGFRNDPLRSTVDVVRNNGETQIVELSGLKEGMSDSYFEAFFRSCGIGDKISIIAARKSEVLLISFYRFEENGSFQIDDDELLKPFWETISQLALTHFADNEGPDLQSPLNSLSKREKDICQAVLDGLTSDAIAWRLDISLNTVKTYRKRAYAKLGINSKTALFALCKTP